MLENDEGTSVLVSDKEDEEDNLSIHEEEPNPGWGYRHVFVLMSFIGFANVYAMRVNLSVAIVAMTISNNKSHEIGHECPGNVSFLKPSPFVISEDPLTSLGPKFDWSEKEKGLILGSFFYGYVITQIPGGYLAEKYGGKWLFGLGTLSTAVLTVFTPLAASLGTTVFVILRIVEGLAEGVTFPVMHSMISKWTHKNERSKLGTLIWTGANFGTIVSLPISGLLSNNFGWPWAFYSFGIVGIVWFLFWCFLVTDSPEKHSRITAPELSYLTSRANQRIVGQGIKFPPLRKIFTSLPFLAIMVAHFGQNWGNYTFLTELPTYLSSIQHFSLDQNGFLSALPFLLMGLMAVPFGTLSDYLIQSNRLSVCATRKIMNSIGTLGAALGLSLLAFSGCNYTLALVCMCFSVGLSGACFSGYQVNIVDLSPNYAGTLMGISNSVANTCGFLVTAVVGYITNNNPTLAAWRIVFLISMGLYVITNTFFLIFSQGKVQSWNSGR